MSTRSGMWRCCATGTMAAVLPESKEPMSICAPWFTTRSASVRPCSGFVCVSPRTSSSFIPPSDLMPPAALIASAAICAPRRHACPGSASGPVTGWMTRSEEHTSELQSRQYLVCRLLLEKKELAHGLRDVPYAEPRRLVGGTVNAVAARAVVHRTSPLRHRDRLRPGRLAPAGAARADDG